MRIQYCSKCKIYTLKEKCENCSTLTIKPSPPKFSIHDKYGKYRRSLKRASWRLKG
tara:strand:+ start:17435 stop:17602 length:168 start_codon:yes stop_codon:yes gene_type:complete